MRVDLFDFDLPEERIALRPARPREAARLLHVYTDGRLEDLFVRDVSRLFRAGDVLVFNDTRVIPARLRGVRTRADSAINVEATLLKRLSDSRWTVLAKPGKRLRVGDRIRFGGPHGVDATVEGKGEAGEAVLAFDVGGADLDLAIAAIGAIPLPPYIESKRAVDEQDVQDYQTVFAERDGAVAAPTAGLHFTSRLLDELDAGGVVRAPVTLHVGAGTFLPVKADDTGDHRMHGEWREISSATASIINAARAEKRRVIAIGTTALRSLESAADENGCVRPQIGETNIFITPGYEFRIVDGLWTNFHLPRSTLFMLVSAFAGLVRMKRAYAHAIATGYRFYSYGDASLLWRSP